MTMLAKETRAAYKAALAGYGDAVVKQNSLRRKPNPQEILVEISHLRDYLVKYFHGQGVHVLPINCFGSQYCEHLKVREYFVRVQRSQNGRQVWVFKAPSAVLSAAYVLDCLDISDANRDLVVAAAAAPQLVLPAAVAALPSDPAGQAQPAALSWQSPATGVRGTAPVKRTKVTPRNELESLVAALKVYLGEVEVRDVDEAHCGSNTDLLHCLCERCFVKPAIFAHRHPRFPDTAILCPACGAGQPIIRLVDDDTWAQIKAIHAEHPEVASNIRPLCDMQRTVGQCSSAGDLRVLDMRMVKQEVGCVIREVILESGTVTVRERQSMPTAVWQSVQAGDYVKFTLKVADQHHGTSKLAKLMEALRVKEWWGPQQFGVTDKYQTTLIIIGKDGKMTGLHVDWTEAWNLAFALDKADVAAVLALWLLVRPDRLVDVERELKKMGHKNGLRSTPELTADEMYGLRAVVGGTAVMILEQKACDIVHIPSGWAHAVVNMRPCLKMAWDGYILHNLASYLQSWRTIGTTFFPKLANNDSRSAPDCTHVATIVVNAIKRV